MEKATTKQPTQTVALLHKLGLYHPADFVCYFPFRYEDETQMHEVRHLLPGMVGQIIAEVTHAQVLLKPKKHLVVQVADTTGSITLRFLHFYPSQVQQLSVGKTLRIRGEVRYGLRGLEMVHPKTFTTFTPVAQKLTPIYHKTEGLSHAVLTKKIHAYLLATYLTDTLPKELLQTYELMPFETAARILHHPELKEDIEALNQKTHPAWRRVKFDEILAYQLGLAQARKLRYEQKARNLGQVKTPHQYLQRFLANLEFQLTKAQQRVCAEIQADLASTLPMLRLLQGDVGSGKTIVAAISALFALDAEVQVAVMAPTEILAEQLYVKWHHWFSALGIQVAWLSGHMTAKVKRETLEQIALGTAQVVVGTQALIQEKVAFSRLGLVIIDEQHRFGVGQRLALRNKGVYADEIPHQLMMTATPIPRTLAMTHLSDMDVSTIDALPPGRTPILTKLLKSERRESLLPIVRQIIAEGRQVYWVCPRKQESEEEESREYQNLIWMTEYLQTVLPEVRLGQLSGSLTTAEKTDVMEQFKAGAIDILIATTVVEVGVDVPNASLMLIENAENYGLAQLHQLRGRVGRGAAASVCVLLYETPLSVIAKERLKIMHQTTDGFEIAQRDLELRGPGEFLGTRQSGVEMFRYANLETDAALIQSASEAAWKVLENFPDVAEKHLDRWASRRKEFLKA